MRHLSLVVNTSLAFTFTLAPHSLRAQRSVPDVPYVTAGVAAQHLDLYLPATQGFATLIMVHGGGLTQEDKRDDSLPTICATVALAGVGCASINYRLGPASHWPAQPEDIAAAVAWLRHHVAEFHGDSTRLVLLGHSSGCLLVSLVSTDPHYLAAQHLDLSTVRGTVAMGCTLSPVLPAVTDSARLRSIFVTGGLSTFATLEAFLDADPTAHVGPSTPPFLVLVAESEQYNPPILARAQEFAAAMAAAGRPAELEVLPDRRHYTALTLMANPADPTLALVLGFIRQTTGGP